MRIKKHSYLKVKLQESNITYKLLSEVLGITACTLSNKLNGKAVFDLNESKKIIELLEVTDYAEKCKLLNLN